MDTIAEMCRFCGMRGDLDPEFHEQRFGHWPQMLVPRCSVCGVVVRWQSELDSSGRCDECRP